MNKAEVIIALRDYIAQEVLEGEDVGLTETTPLMEIGILNSMELLKLLVFIEKTMGVRVPSNKLRPENLKDLATIADTLVSPA